MSAIAPMVEPAPLPLLDERPAPRGLARRWAGGTFLSIGSATEWLLGLASLVVALSVLAAVPVAQFLSLGYLLESSAIVARTGRLRDGFLGVRTAARVGSIVLGALLSLLPLWLANSFADSAELIEPGGRVAIAWRRGAILLAVLTFFHLAIACARDGRLRRFVWPVGNVVWLVRRLRRGGLYAECRDNLWAFLVGLRLPKFFRLGLLGFIGTLAWLVIPATLIAAGGQLPILGIVGLLLLALVAPWLPFLQVGFAVEGKFRALFARRDARERFRRAPWAFAFALLVLLLAAVPLYLLKIEMVPREAAWLPGLVFVAFLAPARLLVGWAYARSARREQPRHWLFRIVGRVAIVPVAVFYVLVVFLSQYTSWGGVASLYEQHAFLLPAPFLSR